VGLGHAAKTIEPRGFLRRPPPAIGEQVAADAEHIAAQFLIAEPADIGLQQTAERFLHEVVGI
jgi:hypothetical protein